MWITTSGLVGALEDYDFSHGPLAASLIQACFLGDLGKVTALLADGADPTQVVEVAAGTKQCEALRTWAPCAAILSSSEDAPSCLRLLIEAKIDPDDATGSPAGDVILSPLMFACQMRKHEAVRVLLEAGGGQTLAVQPGNAGNPITPLMLACQQGAAECARLLIAAGQETDLVIRTPTGNGWDGDSALNLALKVGHLKNAHGLEKPEGTPDQAGACECARMLLAKHKEENTPEAFSAKHASDLWCYCQWVWIPNPVAGMFDALGMVQLLLDANVDPNLPGVLQAAEQQEYSLQMLGQPDLEMIATLSAAQGTHIDATTPLAQCVVPCVS